MPNKTLNAETVGEAFLLLLAERGIDYFFANAGTDFAPIIEAYARSRGTGASVPVPVTVPHENVAVGAAVGYYLMSGRAHPLLKIKCQETPSATPSNVGITCNRSLQCARSAVEALHVSVHVYTRGQLRTRAPESLGGIQVREAPSAFQWRSHRTFGSAGSVTTEATKTERSICENPNPKSQNATT